MIFMFCENSSSTHCVAQLEKEAGVSGAGVSGQQRRRAKAVLGQAKDGVDNY